MDARLWRTTDGGRQASHHAIASKNAKRTSKLAETNLAFRGLRVTVCL